MTNIAERRHCCPTCGSSNVDCVRDPADDRRCNGHICHSCGDQVVSSAEHHYDGDARFTVKLTLDVGRVLEQHGYEPLNGDRFVELRQHLFHFLHGDQT